MDCVVESCHIVGRAAKLPRLAQHEAASNGEEVAQRRSKASGSCGGVGAQVLFEDSSDARSHDLLWPEPCPPLPLSIQWR